MHLRSKVPKQLEARYVGTRIVRDFRSASGKAGASKSVSIWANRALFTRGVPTFQSRGTAGGPGMLVSVLCAISECSRICQEPWVGHKTGSNLLQSVEVCLPLKASRGLKSVDGRSRDIADFRTGGDEAGTFKNCPNPMTHKRNGSQTHVL